MQGAKEQGHFLQGCGNGGGGRRAAIVLVVMALIGFRRIESGQP